MKRPRMSPRPFACVILLTSPAFAGLSILRARRDAPEDSIALIVRTGREIQRVAITTIAAIAEHHRPQAVDYDCLTVIVAQLVDELAGHGIERVDVAVAEIADQQ